VHHRSIHHEYCPFLTPKQDVICAPAAARIAQNVPVRLIPRRSSQHILNFAERSGGAPRATWPRRDLLGFALYFLARHPAHWRAWLPLGQSWTGPDRRAALRRPHHRGKASRMLGIEYRAASRYLTLMPTESISHVQSSF
jgi:hypothetical protein